MRRPQLSSGEAGAEEFPDVALTLPDDVVAFPVFRKMTVRISKWISGVPTLYTLYHKSSSPAK